MIPVQTPIIPIEQQFAKRELSTHDIHKEAICVFVALGFFLGEDGFYKDQLVLQAGSGYSLSPERYVVNQQPYFKWHYSPRAIPFKTALDEFTDLFESIIKGQSLSHEVILPLSGGLDSRTQAVALQYLNAEVHSYSYRFQGGFKEDAIAAQIAEACGFDFKGFTIPRGYLWEQLETLAQINQCYTDFTHPRQMAVLNDLKQMQGEFSLGHWGDVLFDSGVAFQDENDSVLDIVYKKVVKPGGLELAKSLWQYWRLDGDFETYLKQRLQHLLDNIDIDHKGAKIRAFKSMYWAPRWTSINLAVFKEAHSIHVPYYDDRMCRFICEIPEDYLANRKLQIAYIKERNPKLARIMWQDQRPYNLFNYQKNKAPRNLPYRIQNKLKRRLKGILGYKYIQRNWELQFLGENNDSQLKKHVFDAGFLEFVGVDNIQTVYNSFKNGDTVHYAHPLSMLLTLSVWHKTKNQ